MRDADRENGEVRWVTISANVGLLAHRTVFRPIARLKDENGELRVPYARQHILDTPEVDPDPELSAEDERWLRDDYGIDRSDGELRESNEDSYAARVSDEAGGAVREESEG